MAKTYLTTAKYMVHVNFEINGVVEKPDVVGAIFGQSEGLLGEEMDLKELQKSGKVGRIEVELKSSLGKTKGEILIPSSMDMVETSLLAAAIEAVDKVGPCEAEFKVTNIEDLRTQKRVEIKERAKKLLQRFMAEQMPEPDQLADEVRVDVRAAELKEYGDEKLPCGPDIDNSAEIILVEGRADVINLLKAGIKNVIALEGSKVPQTVMDLSRLKSVTAFIDGDRGGDLIARKLAQVAKVAFIAKAPDGKEVEELAQKEILLALKRRMPLNDFLTQKPSGTSEGFGPRRSSHEDEGRERGHSYGRSRGSYGESRGRYEGSRERGPEGYSRGRSSGGYGRSRGGYSEGRSRDGPSRDRGGSRFGGGFRQNSFGPRQRSFGNFGEEQATVQMPRIEVSGADLQKFKPVMDELKGSVKAKIFDEGMKVLKEVDVRNLVAELESAKNAKAVVFDGIVTKRLADTADKVGIDYLVGVRVAKIDTPKKTKVLAIGE